MRPDDYPESLSIPGYRRSNYDPTFMELTLEEIRDAIERVTKSRAKKPKPEQITLYSMAHRITVTIAREPQS